MNERCFVFGYGSLLAEHARGHVGWLRGWRRTWGVAMDNRVDVPGYKSYRLRSDASRPAVYVAFVDIEPCAGARVVGVCVPVDRGELDALDARERNYDRIDVSGTVEGCPRGRVWAYRGTDAGRDRLRDGLARGMAVVSRDYLDGVLAGIEAITPADLDAARRAPVEAGLRVLDLERVEVASTPQGPPAPRSC